MDFNSTKPIYQQISELICDRIVSGEWRSDERIPSVRELAVLVEVNPNTVMRAYEYLEGREVIYNKRGIGFFVNSSAAEVIISNRKEQFIAEDIPTLSHKIKQLNITIDELIGYINAECNKM